MKLNRLTEGMKKKHCRGSLMTDQMSREGEGECNRLIMWLLAFRLRKRMKRKKRETNTDREAEREVRRKKGQSKT